MSESYFVVGGGGLLGRAIVRLASCEGHCVVVPQGVPWEDPKQAVEHILTCFRDFLAAQKSTCSPIVNMLWCAGAGTTGTTQLDLDAEVRMFSHFITRLSNEFVDVLPNVNFFYASSAGGVYAGSMYPPFTEETVPQPISPYGFSKLACEAAAMRLTEAGATVAIGRITNLYGPGQNLSKAQGLISHICLAYHRGAFNKIFVPLDTIRDYIFIEDMARLALAFLLRARMEFPGKSTIKIISSGHSYTVAELIGVAKGIFKRNIPYLHAITSQTALQARDLRVKSIVFPELQSMCTTTFVAGFAATNADIAQRYRQGNSRYLRG